MLALQEEGRRAEPLALRYPSWFLLSTVSYRLSTVLVFPPPCRLREVHHGHRHPFLSFSGYSLTSASWWRR